MCPWMGLWAVIQLRVWFLAGVCIQQPKAPSPQLDTSLCRRLAWLGPKASSHLLQTESHGVHQGWFCKLSTNLGLNATGKED